MSTPRTDAQLSTPKVVLTDGRYCYTEPWSGAVSADFARMLERERDAWEKRAGVYMDERDKVLREMDEAKATISEQARDCIQAHKDLAEAREVIGWFADPPRRYLKREALSQNYFCPCCTCAACRRESAKRMQPLQQDSSK